MSKGRKIFVIFLIFILLCAGGLYYVNRFILPVKLKSFIETKLTEALHRTSTIEDFQFSPVKGFVIEGIKIVQKDSPNTFIQIEEASFNILIIPLMKQKHIVIPSINLKHPFINIFHLSDGDWNFSDLLLKKDESGQKLPFELFIKKISVDGAQVDFTDNTFTPAFFESLKKFNITVSLDLNKRIPFIAEAQLTKNSSLIKTSGLIDLNTMTFQGKIFLSDLALLPYHAIIHQFTNIKVQSGILKTNELTISGDPANIKVQGSLSIDHPKLELNSGQKFQGNVKMANLVFDKIGETIALSGDLSVNSLLLDLNDHKVLQGEFTSRISSLNIHNQNISIKNDLTIENFSLTLDEQKSIKGQLNAPGLFLSKTADAIAIKGDLNLSQAIITLSEEQTGQAEIQMNQLVINLVDGATDIGGQLSINQLNLNLSETRTIQTNLASSNLAVNLADGKTTLSGLFQLSDLHFKLEDKTFTGNPQINLYYVLNPQAQKTQDYSAEIKLTSGLMDGLPYVEQLKNIQGDLLLQPDSIASENLSFAVQSSSIRISGDIKNFSDPQSNVSVVVNNVDLTHLSTLIPDTIVEEYDLALSGHTSLDFTYQGPLINFNRDQFKMNARLDNVFLASGKLDQKISNIFGELQLNNHRLNWNKLRFNYLNQTYALTGQLENFELPEVSTTVKSDNLSLDTSMKVIKFRQLIRVDRLKGNYFGNAFDLSGDVQSDGNDFKNVGVQIKGPVQVDLATLPQLIPGSAQQVKDLNLQGILRGDILLKGPLLAWQDWQLTSEMSSGQIGLYGYQFKDFRLKYLQRDQNISQLDILTGMYDGTISIKSAIDLSKITFPFRSDIKVDQFNLNKWRIDKKISPKEFAGDLALNLHLSGILANAANLEGNGFFSITNAYLWKLIQQFEGINFNQAGGDLIIKNKKVHTKNLEILSSQIALKGKGWMDFDRKIDLNVTPVPGRISQISAGDIKINTGGLLTQIASIHCKGTINKPKCSADINPLKVLKSSTGILKDGTGILTEGVGSILDDLF